MTRSYFTAAILLPLFVMPALAGSPPDLSRQTPDTVAASCDALGEKGESLANGAGCRNAETGAAVICQGNQCTDYFADPRYAKIKDILDRNRVKPLAPKTAL
jgi:hypothetical protein